MNPPNARDTNTYAWLQKTIKELKDRPATPNELVRMVSAVDHLIDRAAAQTSSKTYTVVHYSPEHHTQYTTTPPPTLTLNETTQGNIPMVTCPDCGREHDILILGNAPDQGDPESIVAWCPCGTVFIVDEQRPNNTNPYHSVYSFYNHHHRAPENGPIDHYSPTLPTK